MVFQNKLNVVKYFLLCFTFMLPFFISSNVGAVSYVQNLKYVKTLNASQWYCAGRKSTDSSLVEAQTQGGVCQFSGTDDLVEASTASRFVDYFKSVNTFDVKNEEFYEIKMIVRTLNLTTYPLQLVWGVTASSTTPINWWVKSIEVNSVGQATQSESASYTFQGSGGGLETDAITKLVYPQQEITYTFLIKPSQDGTTNLQIGRSGYHMFRFPPTATLQLNERTPTIEFYILPQVDVYVVDSAADEAAEKELEGTENIENQTPQGTSGGTSDNQQTTNLIGVFSGFLTQLQSFSATDCNLSLPFPQFIGGTQTVNICQGKDVLGNFITVVGTLAMVGFYIPLAFVLIKMIYNEIRSFTNG